MSRALLAVVTVLLIVVGQANLASQSLAVGLQTAQAVPGYSAYLPLVLNAPRDPTIFGMDMVTITETQGLQKVTDTATYWVRQAAVEWSEVEPTENAPYNYGGLGWLETGLTNAGARGMQVIIVVRGTPDWAQKYPDADSDPSCGPIADGKLDDFGDFMVDLVSRYSVPPYNALYWEIWNEPDVDHATQPASSPFGCWGEASDTAGYGGGYYANMLEEVYPRIKAVNPNIKVLLGGLLLDCDPAVINPCITSKFLDGILANNGGDYFDGVSFHAYDYAGPDVGTYGNGNWDSAWNTTGPVLNAKTQFVKDTLAAHSVTGKFLMNTEVALLCSSNNGPSDCTTDNKKFTKEYYVAQSYAAAIAQGLQANIWYTLKGWRGSALIDSTPQMNALPAYTVYDYAGDTLKNAVWYGNYSNNNVTGYKFSRPGQSNVWVLWSLNGGNNNINLGATPTAIYDAYGVAQVANQNITVGLKPLYVFGLP